jgi:hypothetical protein
MKLRHKPTKNQLEDIKRYNQSFDPKSLPNGTFIAVYRKWVWNQIVSYLSVAIRLFTNSWWNHTAVLIIGDGSIIILKNGIKYPLIKGAAYVLDAGSSGVEIYTYDKWKEISGGNKKHWIFIKPLVDAPVKEYTDYIGKPYDFVSVLLWQPIYRVFRVWLGKKGIAASDKSFCTEVWSYVNKLPNPHLKATSDVVEAYKDNIIEFQK